jgi:peptide deformylase
LRSASLYDTINTNLASVFYLIVCLSVVSGYEKEMAIRKIITTENPILRQKAKKVHHFDPSLQKLVDDMFETMHDANGVGLAAPQIAQSIRVFVAEYEDRKVVMFNPVIVKAEGEELGTEGCLSIPGYVGENIRRATKIVVKGQDVRGKNIRVTAEGWLARILQHEIDHLDGILFTDRLDRPEDLREVREDDLEEAPALAE